MTFTHRPWHKCYVAKYRGDWLVVCLDLGCNWHNWQTTWEKAIRVAVQHFRDNERAEAHRPRWNLAWED